MQYYFIRHGQSQANADRVFAGQSDSPLTALGRQQATDEAKRIVREGMTFDVIISSPLARAYDTASIIARATGYPIEAIQIDQRLMERGLGALQGQTNTGYHESDLETAKGVEPLEVFAARSQAGICDNLATYIGASVLFVSHAGVGMVMQTRALGRDLYTMRSGPELPNARIISLEVEPTHEFIRR